MTKQTEQPERARDCVESLIRKAEHTHDPQDAVCLSQAAINVTNAMLNLRNLGIDLDAVEHSYEPIVPKEWRGQH